MRPATTFILFATLALGGCRGMESESPPMHPVQNMDFQERFDPQEKNPFFADNMSMRQPVPGTVARGMLREDVQFYEGRTAGGGYVVDMPVPTTRELLLRGRERYDIFCTPCHGRAGDGEGIVTTGGFGYTPAPTYHSDRLREMPDGYMFDVIANGIRTMPGYAHQIPVPDRWAITAYIRALQRSQYAREEDVPPSIRAEIRASGGAGAEGAQDAGAQGAGAQPSQPGAAPASGDTTGSGAADTTGGGANQ